MRRHLFILSILTLIMGLYSQPGVAWQEPVKAPSSDTVQSVQSAVEPAVPFDAAAPTGPPAAVQNANATSSAAPVAYGSSATVANARWLEAQLKAEDVPDNNIYLRHKRTYDLPQNKGYRHLPQRVFVLEAKVLDTEYSYSNIVLDTSAGIGVMPEEIFFATAFMARSVEIACYPELGDDCAPEFIMIQGASAIVSGPSDLVSQATEEAEGKVEPTPFKRVDILDKLRRNGDRSRNIGNSAGPLPPPASVSAKRNKSQEILVAYEGRVSPPRITNLRLTFPIGEMKHYDKVEMRTSVGSESLEIKPLEDPRMPDAQVVRLEDDYNGVNECIISDETGILVKPDIFICEAYAWKKGKRFNLMPYLRRDSFRKLPIHGPGGVLPLGPSFDETLGPEAP